MPLLEVPELTAEVTDSYLRYKLAVEIRVADGFAKWVRSQLGGSCANPSRLEVCGETSFRNPVRREYGAKRFFGPVILMRFTDNGHKFEIRSEWPLNAWFIWETALEKTVLLCREANAEVFDGNHLVEVLTKVAQEYNDGWWLVQQRSDMTHADVEACLKETRYEHVVCSFSL
jgi:hypothetical protein